MHYKVCVCQLYIHMHNPSYSESLFEDYNAVGCWPDCKPEGPLFSAEFVCLFVCVSLTGTSTLQR